MRIEIEQAFRAIQLHICHSLEEIDGKAKFKEDPWEREEGGGGCTRTIEHGNIFEKGGVAFSAVHGPGNGCLPSMRGSISNERPMRLTSSLNSKRKGSTT